MRPFKCDFSKLTAAPETELAPPGQIGFGADNLAGTESLMEEPVNNFSGGFNHAGRAVRLFDLSEDLRFTQNHRIQTSGNIEELLHCQKSLADIKFIAQMFDIQLTVVDIEMLDDIEGINTVFQNQIKFHPVAGRNRNRFKNIFKIGEMYMRLGDVIMSRGLKVRARQ